MDVRLNFTFVLRGSGPAGTDQEPVMLGTLAIALLDQRVVTEPVGFGDSRLEIVDDDHLRGATEELEGMAVE